MEKVRKSKVARPAAKPKTNPDIFRFIDFFVKSGEKIRGAKPQIVRGKDGRLVKLALEKISEAKLEAMALWFFERKQNLSPKIGAMLSRNVLQELIREMNTSSFWKEINALTERHYPRPKQSSPWKPFSSADINEMKESIAKIMRSVK